MPEPTIVVFIPKEEIGRKSFPISYNINGEILSSTGHEKSAMCLIKDSLSPTWPQDDTFNSEVYCIQHKSHDQNFLDSQIQLLKDYCGGMGIKVYNSYVMFSRVEKGVIWTSIDKVMSSNNAREIKEEISFLVKRATKTNIRRSIDECVALCWLENIIETYLNTFANMGLLDANISKLTEDKGWVEKKMGGMDPSFKYILNEMDFSKLRIEAERIWQSAGPDTGETPP
jgi:hypothetical protein